MSNINVLVQGENPIQAANDALKRVLPGAQPLQIVAINLTESYPDMGNLTVNVVGQSVLSALPDAYAGYVANGHIYVWKVR